MIYFLRKRLHDFFLMPARFCNFFSLAPEVALYFVWPKRLRPFPGLRGCMIFCDLRGCVIFFLPERLRDFFVWPERLHDFFVWPERLHEFFCLA